MWRRVESQKRERAQSGSDKKTRRTAVARKGSESKKKAVPKRQQSNGSKRSARILPRTPSRAGTGQKRRAARRVRGRQLVRGTKSGFQLPATLLNCPLIKAVTSRTCEEHLTQEGYGDLTSTKTLSVRDSRGKVLGSLNYSLIDSVMSHLASTSEKACVGGRIELVIFGDPDSPNQRVIDAATRLDIDLTRQCQGKRIIYIPLSAQWITSKAAKSRAERKSVPPTAPIGKRGTLRIVRTQPAFACNGDCVTGHAMAIIVTPPNEIEYYEPNGKSAPWYPVVAAYLDRLFATLPIFSGYKVRENQMCPAYGVQAGSGLPLCSYFATLYAGIRMLCPQLKGDAVIRDLLSLGPRRLPQLIRLWHCFLHEYAERTGILEAAEHLGPLYNRVIGRLQNMRNKTASAALWQQLRTIEDTIVTDLLTGYSMLAQVSPEAF